ncbi:MAG: hypothetical protein ACLURV_06515 [Gallintestinimicrobium sp.]
MRRWKKNGEAGFPMRDCSNYHNLQPGTTGLQCARRENRGFRRHFLCQGKSGLNPIASGCRKAFAEME